MRYDKTDLENELKKLKNGKRNSRKHGFGKGSAGQLFKVLDKLTPAFIQDKIGLPLDEIGGFIQNGGQYLTSEKHLIRQFQKSRRMKRSKRLKIFNGLLWK